MTTSSATTLTVDQYIQNFPTEVQEILQKIRRIGKEVAPGVTEKVSYGVLSLRIQSGAFAYYGGYKKHVSVYPIPPGPTAFAKKIAPYIKGKGTLQFPLDRPIPFDLIKEVFQLLYTARLERTKAKK